MKETHFREGRQIVKLGLIEVIHNLFPDDELKTSYSIPGGVFCNLRNSVLSVREVNLISNKMQEWLQKNVPIQLLGKEHGYYHYQAGDLVVHQLYPGYLNPSEAEPFTIIPFSYGFIVFFPVENDRQNEQLTPPYLLSEAYERTQRWLFNIGIEVVQDVNSYVAEKQCARILSIAEAFHEKQIADIADMILLRCRSLRCVLISGPSSSGKTSFTERLSTQLEVNGLKPVALSLDDYFKNREDTPLDENGDYNFECIEALDLELLQRHVAQLIDGETVETPLFDFIEGKRSKKTKSLNIGSSEILIMEGIHALNPKLVANINRNLLFKVYVSALGGLNIDLTNRLPTTEARLIRRLVRDDRFRNISPESTLERWRSVRNGERNNVFPFQEYSDMMFNSSMLYEMNVLRPFAENSLNKISKGSPYSEDKERLLTLLSFFEPMDNVKVPFNSILREFIGGSIYFDV